MLGRHQRALFDSWDVAEVLVNLDKFESELGSSTLAFSETVGARHRRDELQARIDYLRARLGGRTYERFASIGQIHATDCPVARSITCTTPVACKHDRDVCPECDVCNCALVKP